MKNEIDFMADIDESITLEHAIKMIYAARRGYLKQLEEKVLLSNKVAYLTLKLFGKSSEKVQKQPDPQVFDEAKATLQEVGEDAPLTIQTEGLDGAVNTVSKPPKERKSGGRKPIPKGFPRRDVIHDLDENQKQCPCGCALSKIGEEVSEQLDMIPAQIYVNRHVRLKYACKKCQDTVKIAATQQAAIPKTLAAPGLLAHVAVMKYDDHLPLYRQSEIWARLDVDLSRSTLSSWVLKMGSALTPVTNYLRQHIIKCGYVQADETPCQVLKTPGKAAQSASYMWVYLTGNHPKPAVIFDYQQSRKGTFAKDFLNTFQGVLQTDGYAGYHGVTDLEGIAAQGCWAHARRKFYDVWKVAQKEGVASKALDTIGALYALEREISAFTHAEKRALRQEKAKPILDSFQRFLLDVKPTVQKKGLLDKAIQYALNQWESLTYYIQDGAINIDNNAAERLIKPFAVGRKNWLFMGSPDGAHAAATLYSLIETAKLNDVNPEGYLKFLLKHKIEEADPILLEKLMPWNVYIEDAYPKPSLKPKEEDPEPPNIQENTT